MKGSRFSSAVDSRASSSVNRAAESRVREPSDSYLASMTSLYEQIEQAHAFLKGIAECGPTVGFILGTGLGGIAQAVASPLRVPFEDIPHFPSAPSEGHSGEFVLGRIADRYVAVMNGRPHYYQGYSLAQVTFPVRVMARLGVSSLFINSAAGGLNPSFSPGDVMALVDHINFMGDNPLRGVDDPRLGLLFPDMGRSYDPSLLRLAEEVALDLGIGLRKGTYAAVSGPSLETPAETRMLRFLGCDAVGMSTVPEVIVARQAGIKVLALAAVTNVNIPDDMKPITLEAVIVNAAKAGDRMSAILMGVLRRIDQ
jgi:purine-nucleoside phosphorylase